MLHDILSLMGEFPKKMLKKGKYSSMHFDIESGKFKLGEMESQTAKEEERELFLLLISVTGIGPRSAQSILSGISVEEFKGAIQDQNLTVLMSAPGVGKKTAERLILELREKIGDAKPKDMTMPQVMVNPVGKEAVLALMSLGYKRMRAQEKVQQILQKETSLTVEELIRRVLREL